MNGDEFLKEINKQKINGIFAISYNYYIQHTSNNNFCFQRFLTHSKKKSIKNQIKIFYFIIKTSKLQTNICEKKVLMNVNQNLNNSNL